VSITASPATLNEADKTTLTLNFKATGTIPADGLLVTLGGQFNDSFDELQFRNLVASDGLKFVRFNPDNKGFEFQLTKASATVAIPIFDDIVQEADRTFNYQILPGAGYTVSPTAGSTPVTFTDGVVGGTGPSVTLTADKTDLKEGDRVTFKIKVDGTIPAEGVQVYIDSDTAAAIGQFAVSTINLETDITGTNGSFPLPNGDASGFFLTVTQPEATISLTTFDDGANEGKQALKFSLVDGEKYNIGAANSVTLNIDDGGTTGGTALPSVGISLTALTVDRQDNLLAQAWVKNPKYKDAEGVEQTGVSLVNLSLNLNGSLPLGSAGLIVNVTSDIDLYKYLNNPGSKPTTFGAEILGPIYDASGKGIGFQAKLLTPNPSISLRLKSDLLPDGLRNAKFTVAPGEGYTVDTKAGSGTVRVLNSLADVSTPTVLPQVSMKLVNPTLTETNVGDRVTLNFTLDTDPPAGGVTVFVSGGAAALSEFDVLRSAVRGGNYPAAVGSGGFFFNITEKTASISVPVFIDEEAEGLESYTFELKGGPTYKVDEANKGGLVTIKDDASSTLPFVSLSGSPAALVESAETVSRHTFTLGAVPPIDGLIVSVAAPNVNEFDLSKIKVTGGEIAGLTADGFNLKMTAKTTTIDLPVKNDGVAESSETAVFTLKAGTGYALSPTNSKATFTIADSPATLVLPALTTETESNDTLATANDLGLGGTVTSVSVKGAIDYSAVNRYRINSTDAGFTYVDPTEDVDLYKVTLKAGDRVTFDTDIVGTTTTLNTVLRLFDADGKEVATSDNNPAPNEAFAGGNFSYIDFKAAKDGVYYIGVSSSPNFDRSKGVARK
jgi:Bacterial pre-peptidase C-terminal domain